MCIEYFMRMQIQNELLKCSICFRMLLNQLGNWQTLMQNELFKHIASAIEPQSHEHGKWAKQSSSFSGGKLFRNDGAIERNGQQFFGGPNVIRDSISCLMRHVKWGLINLAILIRSLFSTLSLIAPIELYKACIFQFMGLGRNGVVATNYFIHFKTLLKHFISDVFDVEKIMRWFSYSIPIEFV